MKLMTLTRKIGRTTYTVNIYTNAVGKESFEDITLRLISHADHGKLRIPQMNRQSERSA